ncbi:MAG TPA: nucleoside monophosphate kinase [Candidatus Paceibacterota bacterium]|jgi:adenylate kinase|nr:nucleoside monophosphate kinase [Candidatus Paceibacterota bacterium]
MQPQTFLFFGIVGSGKGTQVGLLKDFLKSKDGKESVYIGTGDIFRKIASSTEDNEDTKRVQGILTSGKLMPDDETNIVVSKAMETEMSADKHVIFDGYPRTVFQSEFFEEKIKFYGRGDIKIVYIELSEAEAMKRNLLRGRADDTEAGLKKRFDEYVNNVVPAMNYFKDKAGYTIYTINGEQSVENVQKEIINKLGY